MDVNKNTISTLEDAQSHDNILSVEARRDGDRQYNLSSDLPVLEKGKRPNVINDKLLYPQFEATTSNIQLLHRLISSVQQFGDYCMLDISSEGLSFGINDGNVCKIRLNLNRNIFQRFIFNGLWKGDGDNYTEEQIYGDETDLSDDHTNDFLETNGFDPNGVVSIYINITSFIESINILMKDSKMGENVIKCTFRYERNRDPFILIFEDELIVERCELSTYYTEENVKARKEKKSKNSKKKGKEKKEKEANITVSELVKDFELDSGLADDSIFRLDQEKILFDIIIKSDILHDIIKDMNDLMTDRFILYCKQASSNLYDAKMDKSSKLMFISKSKSDSIGFSKLIIPYRKINIPDFKIFKPLLVNTTNIEDAVLVDCDDFSLSSTYHFHYFAKLMRAVRLSKMIKIRKDMKGITSLLLLLGKSAIAGNQQAGVDKLYGSSIEFMILESISIDEFSVLSTNPTNESLMSKLGYNNRFVEQLIKDDKEIQTIRVGDDGKLVTLDDFFENPVNEFEAIENLNIGNNDQNVPYVQEVHQTQQLGGYFPVEQLISAQRREAPTAKSTSKFDDRRSTNILNLTDQLAMSLLGHANPTEKHLDGNPNVQVEKTFIGEDEDLNHDQHGKKHKRQSNNIKLRKKGTGNTRKQGKNSKNEKSKNNGIETVGGAIEIPLFI